MLTICSSKQTFARALAQHIKKRFGKTLISMKETVGLIEVQWDLPKCKLTGPGFWRALRGGRAFREYRENPIMKIANNIAHVNHFIFIIIISNKSHDLTFSY